MTWAAQLALALKTSRKCFKAALPAFENADTGYAS